MHMQGGSFDLLSALKKPDDSVFLRKSTHLKKWFVPSGLSMINKYNVVLSGEESGLLACKCTDIKGNIKSENCFHFQDLLVSLRVTGWLMDKKLRTLYF